MKYDINGLADMHMILSNERRIGGAIEAESIRLRSGEVFNRPVVTHIDFTGTAFYTIGFVSDTGQTMVVHVNEISAIVSPAHKRIKELKNRPFKKRKLQEKLRYLKRLCEVNEGFYTEPFVREAKAILDDIGIEAVNGQNNLKFLDEKKKWIHIA